jgi:DNA-binding transcriptional regulator of glucitol operon
MKKIFIVLCLVVCFTGCGTWTEAQQQSLQQISDSFRDLGDALAGPGPCPYCDIRYTTWYDQERGIAKCRRGHRWIVPK